MEAGQIKYIVSLDTKTFEADAKKFEGQLGGMEDKTNAAAQRGTSAFATAMATTTALGVAAFGTLSAVAVKSFANYEQLIGGVDTLFKEASKEVQGYATTAYKTAGLSANAYMETVTSFS